MALIEAIVGPVAKLLDKIIPDPEARDRAKLELLKLQSGQELQAIQTQLSAIAWIHSSPLPTPPAAASSSCWEPASARPVPLARASR